MSGRDWEKVKWRNGSDGSRTFFGVYSVFSVFSISSSLTKLVADEFFAPSNRKRV